MTFRSCFVLAFIFLCSFFSASAQDEYKHKAFLSGSLTHYYQGFFKGTYFGGPQGGFGWKNKKGNWHEAELTGLFISKGQDYHLVNIGIRYQYCVFPFKNIYYFTKLKPFIGFGILASTYHSGNYDYDSIQFASRYFENYLQPQISPGIQYNLNQKFYGSLQFPIILADMYFQGERQYNPNKSPSEYKSSSTEIDILTFDRFNARLSFGYKF